MASILVVGQEQRSLERYHRVLSAEGWRVRFAQDRAQALAAVAAERPDLVLTGTEVPGAEEVANAFRRGAGGPGVVVVLPEGAAAGTALGDDRLRLPFADQDLVGAVRRMLAAPRGAAPGAPPLRLTSHDIFGDVLAEVEQQLGGRTPFPPGAPPAPRSPQVPPGAPTAAAPGGPGAASPAANRAAARADEDLQRKLEKTLSGMLSTEPRRPAAVAPPRRPEGAGTDEIEAMLSKTLSELAARPKAPSPRPAAAVAAAAATAAGAAGAAASAPPAAAPPSAAGSSAPPAVAGLSASPSAAMPSGVSPLAGVAAAPGAGAAAAGPAAAAAPRSGSLTGFFAAPALAPPAAAPSSAPASGPRPPASGLAPTAAAGPGAASPPPQPAGSGASVTDGTGSGTGARRRFTGELDLSQLEDLARTRRKPDAASRPGVAAAGSSPGLPGSAAGSPAPAAPAPPAIPLRPAPPTGGGAGPSVMPESAAATQRIQMVPREGTPPPPGEPFGQYTLMERIAVGGMAEVWKARMRGVEGFQKTVAIKKILPYMSDNADFVGMFIDEAKLAAQLSHPNIIHIYDLGKIGSHFYIAMEYVEGKDLRSLLNAGRQRGAPLPLGLALLIAVRLASALDYAHRKRDFEGREMDLVHRDVSPQNVLISFDGDVKLCDFGIAKAVSKAGQTQMGALKGKLQYMSPEQARGTLVDARSDIFSLATVLFEMLTGERLFDGDSEMSVLESVRQVKVRSPRQVDPTIPREIDEIVMRALSGRPEDRFQSAHEFEQRLETVLHALKPSPSHGDLAAYIRRVFAVPGAATTRLERPAGLGAPSAPDLAAAAAGLAAAVPAAPAFPASTGGTTLPPPHAAAAHPPAPPGSHAAPLAAAAAAGIAAAAAGTPSPAASPSYTGAAAGAVPSIAGAAAGAPQSIGGATAGAPQSIGGATAGAPQSIGGAAAGAPPQAAAVLPAGAADGGAAAQDVAPLAALGEVRSEEGAPRRRLLLVVAVAALVIALVAYLVHRHNAAAPAPAPVPPPTHAQTGAPGAAGSGAAPGTAAEAPKVDVEGLVGQELARREEALKQKFEAQQKLLQQELDKSKAKNGGAGSAAAKTAPAANTVPTAAVAAPSPPAAEPAHQPAADQRATPVPAPPPASSPPAAVAAPVPPPAAVKEKSGDAAAAGSASAGSAGAAGATTGADRGAAAAHGAAAAEPPKLVSTVNPEYPPLARKLRIEGVVVLSVLVDEDGHVEDVQLLEPISQNVGINEAALQVARQARYKPATRDGVRVKMWTRLRIPFKLQH